ncbi:MAG: hypothetical protein KC713_03360 [Candidatus Omnitrophica bacterium]|nr:hypothetical protein [Candidatus Omnitrophota bacterium]
MKPYLPKTRLQYLFLICFSTIVITNSVVLIQPMKRIYTYKKVVTHQIIGHQFAGLEEYTKKEPIIGYYSDTDLQDKKQGKLLAHAQYILAPTILDVGNLDHKYILFVCEDERHVWQKMKELNAMPYLRNEFGMILAERK